MNRRQVPVGFCNW